MKDLIARVAARLRRRPLSAYALPPAAGGTPSWWPDFERAYRRHATRPERNPLQRAVTRHARTRPTAGGRRMREGVR